MLAARFPSVDGAWARIFSSTHRTDERAIDDSQAQVELACCAQLRKQLLKEPLPYTMLVPPHQTPEARGPRWPDLGRGQCVPWNTCLQDEDYSFERLPVPDRLSSCILAMPIRPFGEQWFHTLPEVIRNQWPTHGRSMRTPDAIDQLHGLILQQALNTRGAAINGSTPESAGCHVQRLRQDPLPLFPCRARRAPGSRANEGA